MFSNISMSFRSLSSIDKETDVTQDNSPELQDNLDHLCDCNTLQCDLCESLMHPALVMLLLCWCWFKHCNQSSCPRPTPHLPQTTDSHSHQCQGCDYWSHTSARCFMTCIGSCWWPEPGWQHVLPIELISVPPCLNVVLSHVACSPSSSCSATHLKAITTGYATNSPVSALLKTDFSSCWNGR